uniref:Uncharacterized protein n=1 Tax=Pavo cristatus TaxID=9049 RepID=A0A8C9FPS7_PAVCR
MSSQNVSHLPFTGAKLDSFPEFVIDTFALKTSPIPYPSLATVVPASLQKRNGNTAENITDFISAGDINISAQYEAPLRLHVPHVNDAGVFPSSLESQTTGAGKMTLLAKTFNTTPTLAFQLPDNFSLSASYEIGAAHSRLPTKPPVSVTKPFSSALLHSSVTEEDIGSGNLEFIDSQLESSGYLVMADKNPATLSVEEWDTSGTRQSLDPTSISNKATKGVPLQTPSISALQSVIITSVHPLPTQLTSAFFSTTNFTHSVITVLSGVSSGAIPTVGTSEAKPLTRKSSPASPVPASSFLSLGTENTPLPSVMALNTPVLTLTKNNTATKLTSVLSSVGAHTDLPFATRNTAASPVDMTAMFITSKSSTVMASTPAPTAHVPRQIKTTVTDSQKFPSSEITKTSTPYPLTITAALTSITASAKATRLPPTRVENTSAPSETTAAAAFANMTAAPPLDCRLSWNLMVKTGMWVQGFDYAKQHLGQQGAEDEVLPVTQETVVLPLPVRDAPASQEREITQDGSTIKTAQSNETRKSRSPSQNGSIISNESGKPSSSRSSPQKVVAPQKVTKDEGRKRNVPISDEEEGGILFDNIAKSAIDPFDTSSGSVQLIAIKPVALPAVHAASDRSQESAIINGEVNKALKQKSDIEHYRNKLRLKAKRKGYYDFPQVDNNKGLTDRKRMYEKNQKEIDHILDPDPDVSSPFAEPKSRQQMKNSIYRSRQSLNSPSPGETEMDLLVTRERPRRGIRNSGYDTEPEIIEETNVDRVTEPRSYTRSRQAKGHSETSTLSSQPSIDEVRQQMHMLLEEAFSLASAGHGGQSRQEAYSSAPHLPYSEVVTSAPGTMTRPRAGVQWVPTYRPEMYQYSLPRPVSETSL